MISIDESRCTLCGLCIPVCVRRILEPGEESIRVTDPGLCNLCGHCKAVCPSNAPKLNGLKDEEFEGVLDRKEFPGPPLLLKFFRQRRSVRLYKDKPVEKEKLLMVLEAGRFAPTGGNRQNMAFAVVQGKYLERVRQLAAGKLKEKGRQLRAALDRTVRLKQPFPAEYQSMQNYPPEIFERFSGDWGKGSDSLLYHAPAMIVVHRSKNISPKSDLDAGIVSAHMILMAELLGLGTCYIGFMVIAAETSPELRKMLKIPADHEVHTVFTIGYPKVKFLRVVARNPVKVQWFDS